MSNATPLAVLDPDRRAVVRTQSTDAGTVTLTLRTTGKGRAKLSR